MNTSSFDMSDDAARSAMLCSEHVRRRTWPAAGGRGLFWTGLVAVAVALAVLGYRLRGDVWMDWRQIRNSGDAQNAFHQGLMVVYQAQQIAQDAGRPVAPVSWADLLRGLVKRYDVLVAQNGREGPYQLDYTPARLFVAAAWVRHVRTVDPGANSYQDRFTAPMRIGNTVCEAIGAVGLYLLIGYTVRRRQRRSPYLAAILGLVGASLLWFNPNLLLIGHVWPQWDVWLVPFFVFAILAALDGWWLTVGALLAIGAMLKGQMLFVAPIFVFWPLFEGKVHAALRVGTGAMLTTALIASPWLVRGHAWWWIGCIVLAIGILTPSVRAGRRIHWRPVLRRVPDAVTGILRARKGQRQYTLVRTEPAIQPVMVPVPGRPILRTASWIASILAAGLILWPFFLHGHLSSLWIGLTLAIGMLAAPYFLDPRGILTTWAAALTVALFLCVPLFHGSMSWYDVGFSFPTRHYQTLAMGTTSNLPAILDRRFGWKWMQPVFILPPHALLVWPGQETPVPMKYLLVAAYALTLALCGLGAAIHNRRDDARLLIALVAPWVLAYAILPQMHERYLVWANAVGGVAVAVSLGMSLIYLLLVAIGAAHTLHEMLAVNPSVMRPWRRFLDGTHPDIGWLVLLCALIYLYIALAPRRRRWLADHDLHRHSTPAGEFADSTLSDDAPMACDHLDSIDGSGGDAVGADPTATNGGTRDSDGRSSSRSRSGTNGGASGREHGAGAADD